MNLEKDNKTVNDMKQKKGLLKGIGMIFLIGKESSCCSKDKENKSER